MEVSGQIHAPAVYSRYTLGGRFSGLHNRSGRGGENIPALSLLGIEADLAAHSLFTYQLKFRGISVLIFCTS